MPEIYIFYCASCQLAETVKQERAAQKPSQIVETADAAGSLVLIVPWLLHRKASLWDQPHRFNPDRFATEPPRFTYIPFGAGQRICIGAAFAMTEAILILAMVAQRYRLRLKAGHPIEPRGLITLRRRHGLPMTVERRQSCER